jgi:uncharacterized FAD-dependent dehydrogenase
VRRSRADRLTPARTSARTACTASCPCCARGSRRWARVPLAHARRAARARRRISAARPRAGTSRGELGTALILAPGHSARDTWRALAAQGVVFEAKPFQLGVRIEHPQAMIDRARQARDLRRTPAPPTTDSPPGPRRRACRAQLLHVSGGVIVASVSSPGLHERHEQLSTGFANAAIVTTLAPRAAGPARSTAALQESLERAFFAAGGGDTPRRLVGADFLAGRARSRARRATAWA